MDKAIIEQFLLSTMLIENEWGKQGTGFLVRRNVSDGKFRLFLITNKHVLHPEKEKRENTKEITLHFNVKENESIKGHSLKYAIQKNLGNNPIREHPDRDIDVLAIEITNVINSVKNIVVKATEYSLFVDDSIIKKEGISIGEDAIVIGYPLGLKHSVTNFPLVRKTTLATKIGEKLDIPTKENGVVRDRVLRGFLIDGGTSPGSSGSPVIFSPGAISINEGGISLGKRPTRILGIVSEARVVVVESALGDYPNLSGLALAFDAETIKETIELFFSN